MLLNEIATKLLQATNDPNKYETTLTITGAGGFGKTTTAISLCHHRIVKEQFTDGFVFIELGPQATDPSIKLNQLYHLLTGEYLKQCDINHAKQEINQLTSHYYRNLLVIIDDVWHVEDAEPLVKAFSNCKIILTTRMNDIEQYISSQYSVTVGPMTQNEAITLLISGVIDSSKVSQEDMSLLDELAQDVHLWPLLLCLIRGQLSHNLKHYHLSYHEGIQNVQAKLHNKGLVAFDKNTLNASRKLAVKACIDVTLELLTKPLSDKIKTLILWTGIGTSLQTAVLNYLWNISKQEAEDSVDKLWAYGLVQYTNITISPKNSTQHCVEIHAVISQYIIECMDSKEVSPLSPFFEFHTADLVLKGLGQLFNQSYGVQNPSSLIPTEFLKYKQSEIENHLLPYYLQLINMLTIAEPHTIIVLLRNLKYGLMNFPCTVNLLSLVGKEIDSLTDESNENLHDAYKLSRILNQNVHRYLYEKKYDELIETVKRFIKNYPLCSVAQKAVTMVKKIIPYYHFAIGAYGNLQLLTTDYHMINTLLIPRITLLINLHKQIICSLVKGKPHIVETFTYMVRGRFNKEFDLVRYNHLIKRQEVIPDISDRQEF